MGAAASVKDVYIESLEWFRNYFDANLYLQDFNSIDKDHDGELKKWLASRNAEGRAWRVVIANEEIMRLAHRQAAKYSEVANYTTVATIGEKIVDVHDFRAFLIQLFAISLMWVHFKNADNWLAGNDAGNDTLSLVEFTLACRSFCLAHSHEELSEEQLAADFALLDRNNSGSVSFLEICNYCCQFVDPMRHDALAMIERSDHEEFSSKLATAMKDAHFSNKDASPHVSTVTEFFAEQNKVAMDALANNMTKNGAIAEFVEIKMTTQLELGIAMDNNTLMLSARGTKDELDGAADAVAVDAPAE